MLEPAQEGPAGPGPTQVYTRRRRKQEEEGGGQVLHWIYLVLVRNTWKSKCFLSNWENTKKLSPFTDEGIKAECTGPGGQELCPTRPGSPLFSGHYWHPLPLSRADPLSVCKAPKELSLSVSLGSEKARRRTRTLSLCRSRFAPARGAEAPLSHKKPKLPLSPSGLFAKPRETERLPSLASLDRKLQPNAFTHLSIVRAELLPPQSLSHWHDSDGLPSLLVLLFASLIAEATLTPSLVYVT
ncbi:hypothetical protein MA16_Dca019181 [Dendrobium catenatum]|uniref:Uncharacterized protein n=1 Tax=Dendrobium catenatum TaxID=906689 RepID=A0A2I0VYC9_9ASPA|nr:hypothetical protein MA16_Dca019181 [Dendrobium catenatum]